MNRNHTLTIGAHLVACSMVLAGLGAGPTRAGAQARSLIVRLKGPMTPQREARLRALGADVYRHLPLIHSIALRLPARAERKLAALPFVSGVSPDSAVRKCDEFTVGSSGADVAFQQFGLTGQDVTVAVVDSGADREPDLATCHGSESRILGSVSFVGDGLGPGDKCGHGTHVAGIIAGNGASSTGPEFYRTFYGIARAANLVDVRVLDSRGAGTVSNVIAGLQWVADHRAKFNIRIVNLSLGHPAGESYTTDPLCQAVEQAWKAGLFVVCAAGNDGRLNATQSAGAANEGYGTAYGSIQSPANDPYVISVGATKSIDGIRAHDEIASYSSRGPTRLDYVLKPDIIAPGNRIISLAVPKGYLEETYGATNDVPRGAYVRGHSQAPSRRYFTLSGTSMAAPVVAGAAALMLQRDPTLTPDTLKARMMLSADKWAYPDGTTDICTFGAGYLNIPAALSSTAVATLPAVSPSLYRDAAGTVYICADDMTGGGADLWGVPGLDSSQLIWGTQLIWGSNAVASSQLIWGTAVWSDHVLWGSDTAAIDLSPAVIVGE